ncbi:MAG TPA: T9SS type A sorting domain-containing protein [Draconibacterium sp.]|nr:T9SS type A sorting domain-containing protein [Draconibacterium sp.]
MFKAIKLLCVILLMIVANQQYSFAQIINEKKLTNAPFVSLLQSSDNEYIYVGTEGNPDGYEYVTLTMKDLNGEIKWKKTIDWNFDCTVRDATILSDNTIMIAGSVRKSYQSYPFIMKTDANGDTLWTRYFSKGYQAEKVIGTSDGGYLFAYYSNGTGLMKLNANGDSVWSQKIGNGKPYGLAETSEAVYLVVDDEDDNIVLSSIGSSGEILWKRIFGGDGKDQPADVINASNGDDYLIAGSSYSDQTGDDFYIGLLNCFGFVAWTKTFGGKGTDICFDLMEASDGDFIAVGISNSFNKSGKFDYYAVKFDKWSNTIWTRTLPILDNENYLARNIFETSYGSLLVAGPKFTNSVPTGESYLVEFIYPTKFGISFESDKQILTSPPSAVQFTNNTPNAKYYDFVWYFGDGESLASNNSVVFHEYKDNGLYNVKLVAFENDFGSVDSLVYLDYVNVKGITTSAKDLESAELSALKIQPNPFSNKTILNFNNPDNDTYILRIFDQNGTLVKEMDNILGNAVELSRNNLPSGMYFVELSGKTSKRAKLLIE